MFGMRDKAGDQGVSAFFFPFRFWLYFHSNNSYLRFYFSSFPNFFTLRCFLIFLVVIALGVSC